MCASVISTTPCSEKLVLLTFSILKQAEDETIKWWPFLNKTAASFADITSRQTVKNVDGFYLTLPVPLSL